MTVSDDEDASAIEGGEAEVAPCASTGDNGPVGGGNEARTPKRLFRRGARNLVGLVEGCSVGVREDGGDWETAGGEGGREMEKFDTRRVGGTWVDYYVNDCIVGGHGKGRGRVKAMTNKK